MNLNNDREAIEYRYKLLCSELENIYQQIEQRFDVKTNSYILPDSEFHEYMNRLWCIPHQLEDVFNDLDQLRKGTVDGYIDTLEALTRLLNQR